MKMSEDYLRCEVCSCFNEAYQYTRCCHVPICHEHEKYYSCSVQKCESYNDYCETCFLINGGYICEQCEKHFCEKHNKFKSTCLC